MPKKEIKIPIGTIVGANTAGAFQIINILDSKETKRVWEDIGKKTKAHDRGYQIRFKCGKTYYTTKTQVWKCMSPNDVGWRTCYKCNKTYNEPCRWDQQASHKINVIPLRQADLKPGKVFGDLKLIDFAFNAKRQHNYYAFECIKCGAHIYRMTPTNKSDIETCHCPNCNENKYKCEVRVQNYLKDHDIPFKTQFKFADCVYKKSMLPFDCAVFNDDDNLTCLIEYDGEQHYKFIKHWHGDEEGFKLQKLRDKIKTDYCASHGIPLIRIPYTEYDNIEKILDASLVA